MLRLAWVPGRQSELLIPFPLPPDLSQVLVTQNLCPLVNLLSTCELDPSRPPPHPQALGGASSAHQVSRVGTCWELRKQADCYGPGDLRRVPWSVQRGDAVTSTLPKEKGFQRDRVLVSAGCCSQGTRLGI